MKKIILLELCLLFLATTFKGDSPTPGWYIQPIPVNKNIVDIYFTDTLNGWAVTDWNPAFDTGYVLKTTNGGINWLINYATQASFSAIQFIDTVTGYASGGTGIGKLYKTTNSGLNWNLILSTSLVFKDLYFVNKDTGWICDDNLTFGVGLLKTTNGGINWTQQLDNSYQPKKLFFLNKDTGWVINNNKTLYRTYNSGNNWEAIYSFNSTYGFNNIFFTSKDTGWASFTGSNLDDLQKTTNGGNNWQVQSYPDSATYHTGMIFMINSKYGYVGFENSKILKATNGVSWNYQNTPAGFNYILFFTDSLHGWASHGYPISILATIYGGGPVTQITNNNEQIPKDFTLFQNYPNPFNATSNIKYKISRQGVNVQLKVYDIKGKEIATLVNQKQTPGTYEYIFNGNNISSGIYFYSLLADNKTVETKRMMLLK